MTFPPGGRGPARPPADCSVLRRAEHAAGGVSRELGRLRLMVWAVVARGNNNPVYGAAWLSDNRRIGVCIILPPYLEQGRPARNIRALLGPVI